MTNSIGLVGSLGTKLGHDKVKTRLKNIGVDVVKKESDVVPNYVVAAKASDIPEKWSGATQMPKQWLQAMMDIKPIRDLAWIDPKEWMEENNQGGEEEEEGDEGEEEEEGEEGEEGEEARGRKRNSEALAAEVKAEAEAKAKAKAKAKAEAERKEEEAKKKEEEEAKAMKQKQAAQADAKAKAEADANAKAEADAKAKAEADAKAQADAKANGGNRPAKATDPKVTETGTATDWNKAQASRGPAKPGRENGTELPTPVKPESTEPDLAAIPPVGGSDSPEPPSPDPDSSSTSSGSSTSASPKPSSPPTTEGKSPSPGPQSGGPSGTASARIMTPEQEAAEEQAIQAVKKARHAQAELKKAEDEAMKAVDRAKSAGVGTVDYTSDEGHLKEDPRKFLIPAEYREENTEAWGEIMYNTDNGFLLVYEKWGKFYRGYLFSGSEYPFKKQQFLDNGGNTLTCEPTIKSGGRNIPNIFETEIEAIAVMWKNDRVYRAMITLYDPKKPGKILLYNITGLRARYGEARVAKRLSHEFHMRAQESIWNEPRATKGDESYQEYLRKHGADIIKGKRALAGIKKEEDVDNE